MIKIIDATVIMIIGASPLVGRLAQTPVATSLSDFGIARWKRTLVRRIFSIAVEVLGRVSGQSSEDTIRNPKADPRIQTSRGITEHYEEDGDSRKPSEKRRPKVGTGPSQTATFAATWCIGLDAAGYHAYVPELHDGQIFWDAD